MDPFPLHTERLLLRPFAMQDLPAFTAYRNDPLVARYQSWSSYSEADALVFFERQRALAFDADDTWFQIAVERKADGVLLGDLAVHFFDEGRQAELGVTFDAAHQGRGYALEAMSRVIAFLFESGKHRVTAIVDARNLPAQRLFERQGFRREAHYREHALFKGEWCDEYLYALLGHEWTPGSRG
jgi:RimJ/RimL family protein N-acetyltransferase